jgi:hypothetical protein
MAGPNGHDPAEVDIEHDAADVEQQHVGRVGGEGGGHGSRLQNWAGLSNGARKSVLRGGSFGA